MIVGLAADHEGFELKGKISTYLRQKNYEITDFGALAFTPDDDYPNFVSPLAKAVSLHHVNRGIAICGSGIGACIVANKIRDVRAGIIHDLYTARQGVEDDDMNVICIGASVTADSFAIELIECFLDAKFSEKPRHRRRLAEISKIEEMEHMR